MRQTAISTLVLIGIIGLPNSTAANSSPTPRCEKIELGPVWAGTRVSFGGVNTSDLAIVAYYDKDKQLTVDRIDLVNCKLEQRVHLDSFFSGWDSHKEIRVAVDEDNGLHIAGNMHNSPLVYYYAKNYINISDLKRSFMTLKNETSITYPRFLKTTNGLYFLYRQGESGNGYWYANRFKDGKWAKTSEAPYLGKDSKLGSVSAYPSNIVKDTKNFYHMSIVWRKTSDVSSNYLLSYIKTGDFITFQDSKSRNISLPISPASAEMIAEPGIAHGLVNNSKISISHNGAPVVAFTQYSLNGQNGIFVARLEKADWIISEISSSKQRWEVRGGGSINNLPRFSPVDFSYEEPTISVQFPREPKVRIRLDNNLFISKSQEGQTSKLKFAKVDLGNIDLTDRVATSVDLETLFSDSPQAQLRWASQAPNQDKPRQCVPAAPKSCTPPPSKLWLVINGTNNLHEVK